MPADSNVDPSSSQSLLSSTYRLTHTPLIFSNWGQQKRKTQKYLLAIIEQQGSDPHWLIKFNATYSSRLKYENECVIRLFLESTLSWMRENLSENINKTFHRTSYVRRQNLLWHLCLTCCCTNAFTEPAVPISTFPSARINFPYFFFMFCLLHTTLLSAASVPLYPLIHLKARPAGFARFPPSPERPVFTPFSFPCPLVSLPAVARGSGLKGRTPDGHRHVGHAFCDGAWLTAL